VSKEKISLQCTIGKDERYDTLILPCRCPDCGSHILTCNGHDTNVKGSPQNVVCKNCGRSFYPHTSYHAKQFIPDVKAAIRDCIEGGHLNNQRLKAALHKSDSTISALLERIVTFVNESPIAKAFWSQPVEARALFSDETFITIDKKTWYIVAIRAPDGQVLNVDIVEHRTADALLDIIIAAMKRLVVPLTMLITDGFSAYKNVAKRIGHDLLHVQCIHKPPYKRVIIDQIHHEGNKIFTTTLATGDDILNGTNAFIAQESCRVETKVKGKPGRPKGSKNGSGKKKQQVPVPETHPKDKRPREYRNGTTRVFFFDAKAGTVTAYLEEGKPRQPGLESLIAVFSGMCITTNIVESFFSLIKQLLNFRGRRSVEQWRSVLKAYVVVWSCPHVLEDVIEKLDLPSRIRTKAINGMQFSITKKLQTEAVA
jgi:transposase-like protein